MTEMIEIKLMKVSTSSTPSKDKPIKGRASVDNLQINQIMMG